MKDPVVHPNGDSYERSTALEMMEAGDDALINFYPNRALKAIIEGQIKERKEALQKEQQVVQEGCQQEVCEDNNSITTGEKNVARRSFKKLDETIRTGWNKLLDGTSAVLPFGRYKPLPESFFCPITYELISNPVVEPDGNTYEKIAIHHWIDANGTSPITRQPLTIDQLYDNNALSDIIDEEKHRSDDSIHPSIRQWKEEKKDAPSEYVLPIPTTEEDMASNQRRRPRINRTKIAIFLLFIILVISFFYVPYLFTFALFLFLFTITFPVNWLQRFFTDMVRTGR